MSFFKLKSGNPADAKRVGTDIIDVSKSLFQTNSKWEAFDNDTRGWLAARYIYDDTPDHSIPPGITFVPVYDTPTKMHVRVPWHADIATAQLATRGGVPSESYNSFEEFMARYFMRRCR